MAAQLNTNSCGDCYHLTMEACIGEIRIPFTAPDGTTVWFEITDKFRHRYRIEWTVSGNYLTVPLTEFPDNLFTQFSGKFTVQFFGVGELHMCNPIDVTICDVDYSCIVFDMAETTYIGDTPTPPVSDCICGWAFGVPTITQRHFGGDNDQVSLTIDALFPAGHFNSTGDFQWLTYQIIVYQNGIVIDIRSGTVNSGFYNDEVFNNGKATYVVEMYLQFSDGAAILFNTIIEDIGIEGFISTNIKGYNGEIVCNEIAVAVEAVMQGDPSRVFNGAWYGGTFTNQLVTGDYYTGEAVHYPTQDFDLFWKMGIVAYEWTDLPEDTGVYAGIGNKFVACVENETPTTSDSDLI